MACKIVSASSASIVLEAERALSLPYHFDLHIDATLLNCEVKMQRGPKVFVTVLDRRSVPSGPGDDKAVDVLGDVAMWTGR